MSSGITKSMPKNQKDPSGEKNVVADLDFCGDVDADEAERSVRNCQLVSTDQSETAG